MTKSVFVVCKSPFQSARIAAVSLCLNKQVTANERLKRCYMARLPAFELVWSYIEPQDSSLSLSLWGLERQRNWRINEWASGPTDEEANRLKASGAFPPGRYSR